MREIAARVGVNKSTVSRVLSGHDNGAASTATAEAIRKVAEELGYRIDPWAASLRTRRTHTIGVLLPRLNDIVLSTVFEAIEAEATRCGLQVLVASTDDDPLEQRRRIALLEERRVDGFILMSPHLGEEDYLDELKRQGLRFVLAYRRVGEHPSVHADDYDGGRQAAEHLLGMGHRRIGVIARPAPAATARVQGFRDTIAAAGVTDEPVIVESGPHVDDGADAGHHLVSTQLPPTAIFAVNDFLAMGAMGAIHEAGLQIGTDVAIVGYNDIPLSARLPIPLTSVRSPIHDIGRLATQRLLRLLEGEVPESLSLPVKLQIRASSKHSHTTAHPNPGASRATVAHDLSDAAHAQVAVRREDQGKRDQKPG